MPRLLSNFKNLIVPKGKQPRTIKFGAFHGLKMSLDLQSESQIFLGLYEREIQPYLLRFSEGIKTGIDIGAGEGDLLLFLLRKTEATTILSFEPDPARKPSIAANLALNSPIDPARYSLHDIFLSNAQRSPDTAPLDAFLEGTEAPYLVKLDVEGAEADVLKGATKLLRQRDVRWIIETHALELEQQCIALLQAEGYTTRIISPAWWRRIVPEHRPTAHNRWLAAANTMSLDF